MDLPNKTQGSPQAIPEKKVQAPVVPLGAVKVKRPATRRFMDFLFADSPKNIASNVAKSVLVPRVKEGVQQALNSFINGMLWGNGAAPNNYLQGQVLRGGAVNYNGISSPQSGLAQAMAANQARPKTTYQDLRFPSQQNAETVLANLFALLESYRQIAIGDLNDMVGISSQISDNAYGWTSLEGARISQDRGGFLLELPRPILIG